MTEEYAGVELVEDATVRRVATAVVFAALTAVLAQASIQLPGGIPFSFQPFAVFFAALVLGPAWGGFAMVLYVATGVAGAPIFSNGGAGLGYVAGPTGGFLVGFVLAAVVIGAVAHRRVEPRSPSALSLPWVIAALLVGLVPIYGVGVPWFATVADGFGLSGAAAFLAPFLVGDLLKVAVTVGIFGGSDELLARLE